MPKCQRIVTNDGTIIINYHKFNKNHTLDLKDWNKIPTPLLPREKPAAPQPNNKKQSENKRPTQIDLSEIQNEKNTQKKLKTIEKNENNDLELDYEKWNIVGTCQDIEKPYLRLTKEPSPDQIRPEEILKKSLKFLLNKWKNRECEYQYIQDQFRSIRQDLVIQHIRNEFTAKVCENNARICLEVDDIGQYMQCCATLFDLYQIGIQGQKEEFYCYKIIDYGLNIQQNFELPKIIYEIQSFIEHPLIQFAIDLIDTYNQGNVYKFYQMYEKSPNMCQCIIERNITRLRLWGLSIVSKSFQQKMFLINLKNLLKFENLEHTKEFIISCGAKLDEKGENLLLKESWKAFYEAYSSI
ncbi:sac3 ganp domain protein [Ichthyophthirius multifiliis]|uniref:Sac3 ganp domain protein n=1 Tax=Ichthyophthirius multifiliis TaxID=5932 RepID=G0QZM2_ICHMU|nr:sac3 ganp domain protein [Ichthyophthirius multifiliis]EGR29333.1 sac3 ganp domain protein [Ichthyophthirius multifiliis]|eukprot:XP_004030569.1 sac3 ganp domain protein [Ichthyophthirius multifiliis]